jgi:hypothetical protein
MSRKNFSSDRSARVMLEIQPHSASLEKFSESILADFFVGDVMPSGL